MIPAFRLTALGVSGLILFAALSQAPGTLPDRLDDAAFWKLVTES